MEGTGKGKKKKGDGTTNLNVKGVMGGAFPVDDYQERPRPNLFKVIKKFKEMKAATCNRILYIAKINEKVFKGDAEKEMTNWTTNVCETVPVTD